MFRFLTNLTSPAFWKVTLYRPSRNILSQSISICDYCTRSNIRQLPWTPSNQRQIQWTTGIRHKSSSKDNPYPPLNEGELEEKFVQGSGPGGQNVNKLSNCVMLKHIPSGEVIKCHEHRLLAKNRITARLRMQERLDWYYNRDNSIKLQEKRDSSKRRLLKKNRTNDKLAKLQAFKEREGLD